MEITSSSLPAQHQFVHPSRLLGVQMGMLTAEDIARLAVVKIDTAVLFHDNNLKPVSGGLFSQEMGNVDPAVNYVCPTDGKLQDKCPGYFGYISLVRPVPWFQHLKRIKTTLKLVCRKCSALLVPQNPRAHRMLSSMAPGDRIKQMQSMRLGHCPMCSELQPADYEFVDKRDKGWSVESAVYLSFGLSTPAVVDSSVLLDARKKKAQMEKNLVLLRVMHPYGSTATAVVSATASPATAVSAAVSPSVSTAGGGRGAAPPSGLIDFEEIYVILKRISRYDAFLLGFDWDFARPEAMICKNLPVTPPAVRPSVRPDSGQRSEDDQTSIYHNILCVNKDLEERIAHMRSDPPHAPQILAELQCGVLDTWSRLAFLVASIYTSKIQGFAPLQQRTGRLFTSVKTRTDGKFGRFRMNLNGKRVNFSARSVIIGAPLNKAQEVSIPKNFAMGLTIPEFVTVANLPYMRRLVENGPGVYPGAKYTAYRDEGYKVVRAILPASSSTAAAPRLVNVGDIVYRHLQNGDPPLFNRQPSLGKPSIMGVRARVTTHGQTLCMPLDIVTPFNADFDGDEMNLHVAQSSTALAEAIYPSGVANHIISPTNAVPIIAPHQDAVLGMYLMSEPGKTVSVRQAMSIVQHMQCVNYTDLFRDPAAATGPGAGPNAGALLPLDARIETRKLISLVFPRTFQFLMHAPASPITPEEERLVRIENGQLLTGRLKKSLMNAGTRGILHRLFNDYGQYTCLSVINQLHDVMREFLMTHSFSLSASDFVCNASARQKIDALMADTMRESQDLLQQVYERRFQNNTLETNYGKFEFEINNILNRLNLKVGQAVAEVLDDRHNVLTTIRAESKGNMANNIQMLAMFGQQNVEGMRVPLGSSGVVLPYFQRFSLGPDARGFLKRPFAQGLTPVEQMYAANGGRAQLIEMSLKTSRAGYIQRRLVKFMEAILTTYDFTVRNGGVGARIVQFAYGDNFVAPEKLETVPLEFVTLSSAQLMDAFLPESASASLTASAYVGHQLKSLAFVLETRDVYLRHMSVLDHTLERFAAQGPVAFHTLLSSLPVGRESESERESAGGKSRGRSEEAVIAEIQRVLLDGYDEIFERMPRARPGRLFKACYLYFLNPETLRRRFRGKLSVNDARLLVQRVQLMYLRALVPPGKYVGVISGQSCGSSNTQSALNSSKTANGASRSSMRLTGIDRMEELMVFKTSPLTPSMTLFLTPDIACDPEASVAAAVGLKYCILRDLVRECSVIYAPYSDAVVAKLCEQRARDPFDHLLMERYATFSNRVRTTDSNAAAHQFNLFPCVMRFEFSEEQMLRFQITMHDIVAVLTRTYQEKIDCVYSTMTDAKLVLRVSLQNAFLWKKCGINKKDAGNIQLKTVLERMQQFQNELLDNTVMKGVARILDVSTKVVDVYQLGEGEYQRTSVTVLETCGSNFLDVLARPGIDATRSITNNIHETYRVLGKLACRALLIQEIKKTLGATNFHNVSLFVDKMLYLADPCAVNRTGIRNDQISQCTKATFETQTDCMIAGSRAAAFNPIDSPSMSVMTSQRAEGGTNICSVLIDFTAPIFAQSWSDIRDGAQRSSPASSSSSSSSGNPSGTGNQQEVVDDDEQELDIFALLTGTAAAAAKPAATSMAAETFNNNSSSMMLIDDDDDIQMIL